MHQSDVCCAQSVLQSGTSLYYNQGPVYLIDVGTCPPRQGCIYMYIHVYIFANYVVFIIKGCDDRLYYNSTEFYVKTILIYTLYDIYIREA